MNVSALEQAGRLDRSLRIPNQITNESGKTIRLIGGNKGSLCKIQQSSILWRNLEAHFLSRRMRKLNQDFVLNCADLWMKRSWLSLTLKVQGGLSEMRCFGVCHVVDPGGRKSASSTHQAALGLE